MKISVIVPVYNVEDYLCACMDSVVSQTYKNYEVVLVDDGSTDKSGILCDAYQKRYPEKVIAIHTPNTGPLHARLRGIEKASGEILVFLDSDDTLRTDALGCLACCFAEKKCDMVLFDAGGCDEFAVMEIKMRLTDGQVFEGDAKKELYQKLISGHVPNSISLKAVRKDSAVFPESFSQFYKLKHGEDLLMSAYMMMNCKKIAYLAQGLYHYRMRPGSIIHSFNPQRIASVQTVHEEIAKYIDLCKMPELKPVHNARKVRGWVDHLVLLLKNKDGIPCSEFQHLLKSMATDPYFLDAYAGMDRASLSLAYRIIAYCLLKQQYSLLTGMMRIKQSIQKIKKIIGRKHGG